MIAPLGAGEWIPAADSLPRPVQPHRPPGPRKPPTSRRRDCHLMARPCTFIRCFNTDKQGCHQNDCLADGHHPQSSLPRTQPGAWCLCACLLLTLLSAAPPFAPPSHPDRPHAAAELSAPRRRAPAGGDEPSACAPDARDEVLRLLPAGRRA